MSESKRVALIIMDGWGEGEKNKGNAVHVAKTPFVDSLYGTYPHSYLTTCGEAVGLPDGQMGNSEVGHLNIGAGRVVYQELARINKSINEGEFEQMSSLVTSMEQASNNSLHLIGLVSSGGVHSHIDHLIRICHIANEKGLKNIFIHCFMDGRDTDPKAGLKYIIRLQEELKDTNAQIASVIGRYYAMDRDKRWERIKKAYDLMTAGKGVKSKDLTQAINNSYNEGITDEFILPIVHCDESDSAIGLIRENDTVLCFNFRTDRCRQITSALTQENFPEYNMQIIPLHYTTMTRYDESFKGVHVIFENENLTNTLGEVLEQNNKKQLRIAETEKYPHVTFFFSGGRENEFDGESRIVVPSPKVATYDLQPTMSALEVTDAVIGEINKDDLDFICLNFANPDMVAHTGVFEAAIKAVETVDECVSRVCKAALDKGYSILITSDHGNADYMLNPDSTVNTAHSMNPVPCFLVETRVSHAIKDGKLGDLAPTILKLMGIKVPPEMSGECLID